MTEQQYPPPPLRPQPGVQAPRRPPPWPAIIGVVFLALLATILLLVLLTDGDGDPGGSPSAEPSSSASAPASASPSVGASASAPASATTHPSTSPVAAAMAVDTIAAAAVDGLAVRAAPGTDAERLGSIASGMSGYVAAGPTDANGYRWYALSALGLPPGTGCEEPIETDPFSCPGWFGWVASADPDGGAWLVPSDPDCPDEPLTAVGVIEGRTDLQRLACFGGDSLTFRAWWPELPEDAGLGGACAVNVPSGWLYCQNINYNQVTINENEGFGGIGALISIDPASGAAMPERGTWVELVVHLDDPAAQGCAEVASTAGDDERPAEQVVLHCRAEMVLESATAVDGP